MRLRAGVALLALAATACGQGSAVQTATPTESSPSPTPIDRTYTEFTTYQYRGEREDPFDVDYPTGWWTGDPHPTQESTSWGFSFEPTEPPVGQRTPPEGERCPELVKVHISVGPGFSSPSFPEAQGELTVAGERAEFGIYEGDDPVLTNLNADFEPAGCLTLFGRADFQHDGTFYGLTLRSTLAPTDPEKDLFGRFLRSLTFV